MLKQLLQRVLPRREYLAEHRCLHKIANIQEGKIWQINHRTIAKGVAIGFFIAFLPLPLHMLLAAGLGIIMRANVLMAVASVWLCNPLTMAPMWYFAYQVGAYFNEIPVVSTEFSANEYGILQQLTNIWQPLLLGSVVCGLALGLSSYVLVNIVWRTIIAWRWRARKRS